MDRQRGTPLHGLNARHIWILYTLLSVGTPKNPCVCISCWQRWGIVDASQTIRNYPGILEQMRRSMMRNVEACLESHGGHFEHFLKMYCFSYNSQIMCFRTHVAMGVFLVLIAYIGNWKVLSFVLNIYRNRKQRETSNDIKICCQLMHWCNVQVNWRNRFCGQCSKITISMKQGPSWEDIMAAQLVKKFTQSHGTERFITVFITAWPLAWARRTQSTPSHPVSI
jgi:hypothetical protein